MSVLLTGATGLIGRHVLPPFAALGPVWAVARRPPVDAGGATWLAGDLADGLPPSMPSGIETVVHLAQSEHFREFPERAADVFDVNVAATARLLDWSRAAGVKRFVLASTGGGGGGRRFYLASKRSAELLAQAYAPLFHVVVLRFFFVYGAAQRESMLVPRLISSVASGEPIRLDGADGLRLNPTHVDDAAAAVVRAACLDTSACFDVAGPEVLTLREMGDLIGRTLGRQPIFATDPTGVAEDLVGDITAMTALVGPPRRRFAAAVAELCRAARPATR